MLSQDLLLLELVLLVIEILLFQTWAGNAPNAGAFLAGFDATFQLAAGLPILVVLLGLARGWGRLRTT